MYRINIRCYNIGIKHTSFISPVKILNVGVLSDRHLANVKGARYQISQGTQRQIINYWWTDDRLVAAINYNLNDKITLKVNWRKQSHRLRYEIFQ